MNTYSQYTIEVSDWNDTFDLTNRTLGFSTVLVVGIAEFGSMSCTVTLDNNDGAFTPKEGGGNGIYKNVDWYSKRLRILNTSNASLAPFFGIINSIAIADDGVNSTVTIGAVDWLSSATSAPTDTDALSGPDDIANAIFRALRSVAAPTFGWGSGLSLPLFGDDSSVDDISIIADAFDLDPSTGKPALLVEPFFLEAMTTHDVLSTMLLPAGPVVTWPGLIGLDDQSSPPNKYNVFFFWAIGPNMNRTVSAQRYYFDESPSGSGYTASLPFRNLTVGYYSDMLVTTAEVGSGNFSPAETSTNTDAVKRYGSRNRFYQDTAIAYEADALATAQFWTERGSAVRYTPQALQTSDLMAEQALGANGVDIFRRLMSTTFGPWSRVDVSYTPVGGTTITVPTVIKSRRIDATPQETIVTLELLPATDWQSFTLDDSLMGILGGTFETYEDPDVVYDEVDELYDGVGASGNRLG